MPGRPTLRLLLVLLTLMTLSPLASAQPGRRPGAPFSPNRPGQPYQSGQPSGGSDVAGCAACGVSAVFLIVALAISVVAMVVWIFIAIWAYKDATARGMDNGCLWLVLILFTGLIGLIIYLVSRPSGELKICRECGKKRLREARRCPHCRFA
jgi:hypothetical protein